MKKSLILIGLVLMFGFSLGFVGAVTCNDSDGGKNYEVKGFSNLAKGHEDYCEGFLYEFYCSDDNVITKNLETKEYFYLSHHGVDWMVRYRGADSVSDSNPQVKLEIFDENEDISDTRIISLSLNGSFVLNFGGLTWNFVNASDASRDDFDIKLLGQNVLMKYRYLCPSGTACQNGACVTASVCNSDVNKDGIVDILDMIKVRNDLGKTCVQASLSPKVETNSLWWEILIAVGVLVLIIFIVWTKQNSRIRKR